MKHYTFARKDLTDVHHGVVVHGCNCSNGFGSGVALAVKKKWPVVEKQYRKLFDRGLPTVLEMDERAAFGPLQRPDLLGTIQIVEIDDLLTVVNGFTQIRYGRDKKRYADPLAIQSVLNATLKVADTKGRDIYMPRIGCSLGGLDWERDVEPIVETIAVKADLDGIRVIVCDPSLPEYKEKEWRPK